MPRRTSTVVGREFGDALRAVIERTGHAHRTLASRLGWDHAKLSDLLNGKGGSTEAELNFLLGVCGASAAERGHLLVLFKESRENGWLQHHKSGAPLPVVLRTLLEQEKAASAAFRWSPSLVPGLLQTPEYIRAVAVGSELVPPKLVEDYVAVRIARQEMLSVPRPHTFYVHEHALRLPVGGHELMSDQLHHLLRMSVWRNISVRLVPAELGAHPGVSSGAFTMLTFENAPTAVYAELPYHSVWLDRPESVAVYTTIRESLDGRALDGDLSRKLIAGIALSFSEQ